MSQFTIGKPLGEKRSTVEALFENLINSRSLKLCPTSLHEVQLILTTVINQPKTKQWELVNDLKRARNTVTKATIGDTPHRHGFKS